MDDSEPCSVLRDLPALRAARRVAGSALAVVLLASAPAYGQPAGCTAPSWSVTGISVPPGQPDSASGLFGARSFSSQLTDNSRTFEARLKARASDTSGLSVLACILQGDCGLSSLLEWLGQIVDWVSFSKGELSRLADLSLVAPPGAEAQIRVEGSLDGLLAVSSFLIAHSSALVDADVSVLWDGSSQAVLTEYALDNSQLSIGAYFTPIAKTGSHNLTLQPGGQLRLAGHLLAESHSENVFPFGLAIGASQFSDPVGGGPFDDMNPPISIPNPGLLMRAIIVNVSPVLDPDRASVSFYLGQVAANSGTLCDGDGDQVQLSASMGTVVNNGNGTWSWSMPTAAGFENRTVTVTANDGKGGVKQTTFALVPSLAIDIKPKTTSNVIDLRKEGQVAVAILAGENFDPLSQIVPASPRFGRTGNEDSLVRVGTALKPACGGSDANDDGMWDLVCNFHVPATGFVCGDHVGILKAAVPAFGAIPIEGRDNLVLLPCATIQTPTVIHEDSPLTTGVSGVAVSPDGATLYVASGHSIFSIPAGGGSPVEINTGELGYVVGLDVSPDGGTVYAALAHSGLASSNPVVVSLPAAGGPAAVLAGLPVDSEPGGLAVSPDGAHLLIAAGNPRETLLSVPASGGTPVNILSGGGLDAIRDVVVSRTGSTLYLGADATDRLLTVPATGGIPAVVPTGVAFADPVNIALSPDKATLFVLDPNIRIDAAGRVVDSGGWPGAVFIGPAMGGVYSLLVVGGADFDLTGRIDVSPDRSFLYFGGVRRSTGAPVVLRVPTGLNP